MQIFLVSSFFSAFFVSFRTDANDGISLHDSPGGKPPAYLLVLAELFLRPLRWRRYVPPKRRQQLNRLHGVLSLHDSPGGKPPAYLLVLAELFLRPLRWRRYVPPKRRLQLNRLHGVISQKMILFMTSAVETSNPT
jgi:hypothetical protein